MKTVSIIDVRDTDGSTYYMCFDNETHKSWDYSPALSIKDVAWQLRKEGYTHYTYDDKRGVLANDFKEVAHISGSGKRWWFDDREFKTRREAKDAVINDSDEKYTHYTFRSCGPIYKIKR